MAPVFRLNIGAYGSSLSFPCSRSVYVFFPFVSFLFFHFVSFLHSPTDSRCIKSSGSGAIPYTRRRIAYTSPDSKLHTNETANFRPIPFPGRRENGNETELTRSHEFDERSGRFLLRCSSCHWLVSLVLHFGIDHRARATVCASVVSDYIRFFFPSGMLPITAAQAIERFEAILKLRNNRKLVFYYVCY